MPLLNFIFGPKTTAARWLFFALAVSAIIIVLVKPQPMITLTSTAFNPNQSIPKDYTCDGQNINPPLTISNLPDNTQSLALVMTDPDAPSGEFTHWLVWNINPQSRTLDSAAVPPGATQGQNSTGTSAYMGPCPPSGIHHYRFAIYALDTKLDLPSSADKSALLQAMDNHIIEQNTLTCLYSRQ